MNLVNELFDIFNLLEVQVFFAFVLGSYFVSYQHDSKGTSKILE